ncbi:hypothetical protein NVP1015O_06 [Vibrio phage 1.015.O._10N.222.51.E5]|nr:hypothetical protein NVP1015O_06 [Vibrio phage 1.015.O._10N.222.51.E5]
MALITTVFTLNSYTDATYTDIVPDVVVFTSASVIVANTTAGDLDFAIRLVDGSDVELAIVVPTHTLALGDSVTLDISSLNVPAGTKLQVFGSATGLHFTVSGVTEV